ncbi:MAG: cell division protein ZapB [Candidatus Zixiibacteriota bacterium]|nr:MAG: cell division protein ZapB [candidate division Zixibacteria bacterium]
MTGSEKFALLEERIDAVIAKVDRLKSENSELARENSDLKKELTRLNRSLRDTRLVQADQSETARSKLVMVLNRLEQLEAMGE